MRFTRQAPIPPLRPTKARIHVRPVVSDFSIRKDEAPTPAPARVAARELVPEEGSFIKPPSRARLMARR